MADLNDVVACFINYYSHFDEGNDLTNLKLQKLLYFAQGTHLARTGQLLFNEDIQAWKLGPVVPAAYEKYSAFASKVITEDTSAFTRAVFTGEEASTLLDVCHWGFKYSATTLVNRTHAANSPWDQVFNKVRQFSVIPVDCIKAYFSTVPDPVPNLSAIDLSRVEAVGMSPDGYPLLDQEDALDDWSEFAHEA